MANKGTRVVYKCLLRILTRCPPARHVLHPSFLIQPVPSTTTRSLAHSLAFCELSILARTHKTRLHNLEQACRHREIHSLGVHALRTSIYRHSHIAHASDTVMYTFVSHLPAGSLTHMHCEVTRTRTHSRKKCTNYFAFRLGVSSRSTSDLQRSSCFSRRSSAASPWRGDSFLKQQQTDGIATRMQPIVPTPLVSTQVGTFQLRASPPSLVPFSGLCVHTLALCPPSLFTRFPRSNRTSLLVCISVYTHALTPHSPLQRHVGL